jgi:hypothetical protein
MSLVIGQVEIKNPPISKISRNLTRTRRERASGDSQASYGNQGRNPSAKRNLHDFNLPVPGGIPSNIIGQVEN